MFMLSILLIFLLRKGIHMKYLHAVLLGGLLLAFAGCATVNQGARETVSFRETWAILPFVNNTETPFAEERAESVTATLLHGRGLKNLVSFPKEQSDDEVFVGRKGDRQKEAMDWARKNGYRYAVTGVVNEWRYKVGMDGEPVVGITLEVLDLSDGRVSWSATGAKSGWSRDAVSAVAQQVIDKMLESLSIK